MDMLRRPKQFLSFWYQRYLLATELYMVEPWEKLVIHVMFTVLFALFWYFNYKFVINSIGQLRSTNLPYTEQVCTHSC